ncbi:MAG: TatD family hydrolase [Elusimicrobia bacterium]|nr:TatD family hydrolase [Elusimicrobiota bacterium]
MEWFDTHAHLGDGQFSADREAVLERALQSKVLKIVEIADSPAEWEGALAMSRARPAQVRASLGLHPYYADQYCDELVDDLAKKAGLPEVVAVGEIGLDYVKTEIPKEVQLKALASLLSASLDWDKPVVVHCRGAYEDLRLVLERLFRGKTPRGRYWGVVHCFSGTAPDALFCRDLGFALGVDGPVTYPKNESLRQALREAGVECLVLETDSPYLPPQSSRGKRNEPAAIPEIGAALSAALGVAPEAVAAATTKNALDLFRWPR